MTGIEVGLGIAGVITGLVFLLRSDIHPFDRRPGLFGPRKPPPAPPVQRVHGHQYSHTREDRWGKHRYNILESTSFGPSRIDLNGQVYWASGIDWWNYETQKKVVFGSPTYRTLEAIREKHKVFGNQVR